MPYKPTASIFIGYRRRDSQGFAGRLADDLIEEFGVSQIFRDDDIPEGSDYTRVLEQALSKCSVLVAVIGSDWLTAVDRNGRPRIHQPDDWVRQEIEAALERGIWVQPVLIGNALMPSTDELPESLSPMTRIQAVKMSDRNWENDLESLITLLIQRLPELNLTRPKQASAKPVLTLRNVLEKLAQTTARKRTTELHQPFRLFRLIGRLALRLLWLGVAVLFGWYVFDNHATSEFRQYTFEFLAFAQDKISDLMNRFFL